jgi:hypothetical protein
LANRSFARARLERDGALVVDEIVIGEPILADDDKVGQDRADILDETR